MSPTPDSSVEQAREQLRGLITRELGWVAYIDDDIDALIAAVRAESQAALVQAEQARDEARQALDESEQQVENWRAAAECYMEPHAEIVAHAQRDLLARVREIISARLDLAYATGADDRKDELKGLLVLLSVLPADPPPSDPPAPKE